MDDASHDVPQVLVICHANVCRSPLAAFILDSRLAFVGWHAESRGTRAAEGMGICPAVGSHIAPEPRGAEFAQAFRSHRLLRGDLDAPLVLSASRAEKSAAAQLAPSVRRRLFTLAEAASLAEAALARTPLPREPAGVAHLLDTVRREAWLRTPLAGPELDVPDAHVTPEISHAETISSVFSAVSRFAAALLA